MNSTNGGHASAKEDTPSNLSTSALENKLKQLREQSQEHSQVLTQKLASSESGQDLLHIGTSLSTLPPDLHSLLQQLHPVLGQAEAAEKDLLTDLTKLTASAKEIRLQQRRQRHAAICAELYADLTAAETKVRQEAEFKKSHSKKKRDIDGKE